MTDLLDQLRARDPIERPIAIVAAHPDDETIGLGACLERMRRLRIVHLTDGAPRDLADARRQGFDDWKAYAAAREQELQCALYALGAADAERLSYGYPDQQALFHAAEIVDRLARDIAGMAAVFTHAYEHGHPDHDTAALAVVLACEKLAEAGGKPPERFEFPSYQMRDGGPVFGAFWPDENCSETAIDLNGAELARKVEALACFVTQRATLAAFPLSPERVRRAPAYDFTRPAPPRAAVYESWGFTMTSEAWRQQTQALLNRKALQPCP